MIDVHVQRAEAPVDLIAPRGHMGHTPKARLPETDTQAIPGRPLITSDEEIDIVPGTKLSVLELSVLESTSWLAPSLGDDRAPRHAKPPLRHLHTHAML
jgi:hypothetical protein